MGIGRHGVDPLFAPCPEKLDRGIIREFRIVEFRDRRRVHHVAPLDLDRIGIGGRNLAMPRDILIEFDMHQPVFLQLMHLAGLAFARLQEPQRLGDRHLIDKDLPLAQRRLGDPVAGLDHARAHGRLGGFHPRCALEELADRDRVGGIIRALVDHFEAVFGHQTGRRHLHPARAPAVRHRHFAACEGHLIARHGNPFEDRTADHPLGLLVQIGEVILGLQGHSAAST